MTLDASKFPSDPVTAYSKIRDQLQNGDVLICSGNGVFSSMIQQATDSDWSHVGFVLRIESADRVMLLESVEPLGVRTVRLSKYLNNYSNNKKPYPGGLAIIRHNKFKNSASKPKLKQFIQFAVDQMGYPYDKKDIAKIAARILASKVPFTKKQRKKIAPNKEFICSEYVERCYAAIGLNVQWNQLGFIAPSDFAKDSNFNLVAVLKSK